MKKKLISMVLVGAMSTMMLAGCGGKTEAPAASAPAAGAETAAEEAAPAEEGAPAAEASVINFDEDPYEIAITLIGLNESNNDLDKVEEELNKITLEKINATVDIQPLFIGDMGTTTTMGIAGGEKMDIVTVGLVYSMSNAVSDGVLLPLDDLLAERGQAAAAVTADVAEAQKINGVTYALTGYPYSAMTGGFAYNKTLAEEWGIDMHDYMTWDELTEAAKICKEHGIYFTKYGNSSQLNLKFESGFDVFGASGDYGVILDPANSSTIENVYASDIFEKFCERQKDWFDNGYLPADQMTDSTSVQQLFANQQVFCTSTAYTPDQIAVWLSPDFETGIIKMADGITMTGGVVEMMLGIAATSERPDKCMDLLNLIYSDRDVANLLNYGVEGLDYARVEGTENVITYEGTPNADHSGYYTSFSHFGDPTMRYVLAPLTDSYIDDLKAFNEEAKRSKAFGYSFNAEMYPTEAAAISAVLQEKLPMLNAGQISDVKAGVDDLVASLEQAGINDVIAGNQEQLDAYLAQ
ncbi:MAG: ABC transporter substrate-binding protein [Lachnospiraceae bacterium]|nr:ABC transporter substrate-binding protein [Lachnospiraceae bacterium]MBQ9611314.1 ABC transporter substrate-binding protein [Lachnospiraceae bacterium]